MSRISRETTAIHQGVLTGAIGEATADYGCAAILVVECRGEGIDQRSRFPFAEQSFVQVGWR